MFADELEQNGWTVMSDSWGYEKGEWKLYYDTSSWMILETKTNPRVFDIHVPGEYESHWTVNLIEHLCRMEDERHRLREALERIREDESGDDVVRSIAKDALEQCYHRWLINPKIAAGQPGRVYCPICKRIKDQ
jgi:hypothetical protein